MSTTTNTTSNNNEQPADGGSTNPGLTNPTGAGAGSPGESDPTVASLVEQYKQTIAQGRASFNAAEGYSYQQGQEFQLGMLNLFTNPAYQPYLDLLPAGVVQELVGEVYEFLVTSSLRLAYQFPTEFGLTPPQIQSRLAGLVTRDSEQTLALIRSLVVAAFSEEGVTTLPPGLISTINTSSSSSKAGQEPPALSPAKPARWTRSMVAALVKEPVDSTLYLGQDNSRKGYNRPPMALANDKLVVAIVRLLGRYGAMTNFQLRSWLVADYLFNSGPLAHSVLAPTPLEALLNQSAQAQSHSQEETPPSLIRSGVEVGVGVISEGAGDVPNTATLRTRVLEALYHARYAGATTATAEAEAATLPPNQGESEYKPIATNANGQTKVSLVTPMPAPAPAPGRVILSDRSVSGWNGAGRPTKMWGLEDGGKLWYTMLTGSSDVPGANSLTGNGESMMLLPHTYGVQQTLAALRSVVNLNNRLGTLPRLLSQLAQGETSLPFPGPGAAQTHWPTPTTTSSTTAATTATHLPTAAENTANLATRRFRMEMEPWATSFPLSLARPGATITAANSRLIPDAVGRFVVDSAQIEDYLLEQANLDPNQAEDEFWQPGGSDELVWPFFLEYDRGTELPSAFAEEKYRKYAELYNSIASSAWLPRWGTKFPVVLVVTEGGASDIYRLCRAVISQVRANNHKKAFAYWWFTTTEWLSAAYRPYLDEKLSEEWERRLFPHRFRPRSGSRATGNTAAAKTPAMGHDARMWLPVGALADLTSIEEVAFYFKGSDPNAPRPALMEKMSALPLPHPLNASKSGSRNTTVARLLGATN